MYVQYYRYSLSQATYHFNWTSVPRDELGLGFDYPSECEWIVPGTVGVDD